MPKENQVLTAEQPRSHEKSKNGSPTGQPRESSNHLWLIIGVLCFAAIVAVCVWQIHKRRAAASAAPAGRGAQGPVPVVAGTAAQKDVPIYLDGLGTVQAFYTVTVHSRVDGELKSVAFTEGQDVHKGDLLAQI